MTLAQALRDAGVITVYLIDDAFDQHPPPIVAGVAQAFVETLTDEHLEEVCRRLGIQAQDELDSALVEALQDALVAKSMFEMRADYSGSSVLFDEFLAGQRGRLAQLQPLLELFKAHEVVPKTFGRMDTFTEAPAPELVFIDLRMLNDQHVNVQQAVDVYRKLQSDHVGCVPFVFLMSSEGTTLREQRDDFREEAKLLRSQFESIEKTSFAGDADFESKLQAYVTALPLIRNMHSAVEHFGSAISEAGARLKTALLSLDLADYFLLHANTAQVEGVGLGVYLSELLLDYLTHEVERSANFWHFAKTLDALDMRSALRMRCEMSLATWSIYSGTVLHAKERLTADRELNRGPSNGYFYLGDIFILAKEFNDAVPTIALAVITPACDLARPEKLKNRSVLLCEGTVAQLKPGAAPKVDTTVLPHPNDENSQLQIEWNVKKLRAWQSDELQKFAGNECSYVNVGRLRPLHALLLQHRVTADLSRVGVARAPTAIFPVGLRAFVRDNGSWRMVDESNAAKPVAAYGEVVSGDEETMSIAVSDPAVRVILRAIRTWTHDKEPEEPALQKLLNLGGDLSRLMYVESTYKRARPADVQAREYVLAKIQAFAQEPQLLVYVLPKSNSLYKDVRDGVECKAEQKAALVVKFTALQAQGTEAAD